VDGLVIETPPDAATADIKTLADEKKLPLIELPPRVSISLDRSGPVAGTTQGLWPGVHNEENGNVHAGPTSSPWIDTNTGFLRFLAARLPAGTAIWMANRPPKDNPPEPELARAIGDSALSGAQWVFAPGDMLLRGVIAGLPEPSAQWKRLIALLQFYQTNRALWTLPPRSDFGLVVDVSTGGLLSGGLVDMFASKQTPVVALPEREVASTDLSGFHMLVNIDPSSLTPAENDRLRDAAKAGAHLLQGPPGWKMQLPADGALTLAKDEAAKVDGVWREINQMIGRANQGARLFNASGLISNLTGSRDGKIQVLHIVNYTDYPVSEVTVSVPFKPSRVRWMTPQGERKPMDIFDVEDGTAVMIDKIEDSGLLIIER
jgi:hypothetical protein